MTKFNALKTLIILLFLIVFLSLGIGMGMGMAASPVVHFGSQGNAVTELQRLLNASGYPVKVDGVFGVNTKKTLISFQQANHLIADGLAGEKTWQKINNTSARFVPVAVEAQGGGRIEDNRAPREIDLVYIEGAWGNKIRMHKFAAIALKAMTSEARTAGLAKPLLLPVSGYRDCQVQARLWQDALKRYGTPVIARKWVAPPGTSAHESGRAVDLNLGEEISSSNVDNLQKTPAYKWLVKNAQRFGFYPYDAEPWHWEYNPPKSITS